MELENRLKTLNKEQKTLQNDQYRREKRLDKIIRQGEPENVKDIQMQQRNLALLSEKLRTANSNLLKNQETKQAQDEKFQVWYSKQQ